MSTPDMGYWRTHQYRRRTVESIETFEGWNRINDLVKKAYRIGDKRADHNGERDAALIATLFTGGFRAGECVREIFPDGVVTGLKRENIEVVEGEKRHLLFKNVMALKGHRKVPGSEYVCEDGGRHYQTRRVMLYRIFPVPTDEPLISAILEYAHKVPEGKHLFPVTPTRAYQIVDAVDPSVWPHWFRAQRAAQLAREYGFDLHSLMEFFQWKDMKTALRYASMGYGGLLQRLPAGKVARIW